MSVAPHTGVGVEPRHPHPPGKTGQPGPADGVKDLLGVVVVGGPDHGAEHGLLAGAQGPIAHPGLVEVGDEQHRLDDAG